MLFHTVDDLWNAMVYVMMKKAPEGRPRLESTSRNVDPSTLLLCKTMTHAPLQAVAVITQV